MSDYVKSTDFASKDTLPSGDSAKIVRGTEIDAEFEALEVAVASKANTSDVSSTYAPLNSPTFTGSPSLPTGTTAVTQTAGDNDTSVATTAFVTTAVDTAIATTKGPAFSAWASVATSLSASTNTKLLFQTEEFDTNTNYDASTSRFTPTVSGYYQFNAAWQAGTVASDLRIFIYKNGSQFKNINTSVSGSVNWTCGSALVYLNGSTDYVEIYGYSALANTTNPTQTSTYFQASMIRAA